MGWSERDVERWVCAVAALDSWASGGRLCPVPPADFPVVRARVVSEQLEGLLVHAIERGAVRLDEAQVESIVGDHTASMALALRLEQAVLAASDVLTAAGVRHLVLKGCALATAVYPDPSRRPFGDVDLLLDPQGFTAGVTALRRAGAVRHVPEVRPGHDRRFAKDVPLAFAGGGVDLHRTLIAGPFGRRIPVEELLDRRREIAIGGRAMGMLDLADAYVHAGLTAGAADVPARLVTLRDMVELEAHAGFDPDAVVARARRWGAEVPVARAVTLVEARLRPGRRPALSRWARGEIPTPTDRFLMRCYLSSARSYRRQLVELAFVPTWRERATLLRALLMPQPGFRAARGWTRREHLGRAVRKLTR